MGSLWRRPGSRPTKARGAQAELSVFAWRASNDAAPYVVSTGEARQRGSAAKAQQGVISTFGVVSLRYGANFGLWRDS